MSIGAKSSLIKIAKLAFDTEAPFEVSQETEWTRPLLDELQEDVDEEDKTTSQEPVFITFHGHIKKMKSGKYQEILKLNGELRARFLTLCVSSGDVMVDEIVVDVNMAAIDDTNREKYGFDEDMIELEVDGEEHDLYYFKENELDLLPVFHEYLYLNKNPYPRINQD